MFDIGFWELIFLFGLGLLVLGPERLPRVAAQLGNWAGQARRMARSLTSQIRDELDIDVRRPFNAPHSARRTPAGAKSARDKKPAWQTSAGLRPDATADELAASGKAAEKNPTDTDNKDSKDVET